MDPVAPEAKVATGSSRPLRRERTRITVAVAVAVDRTLKDLAAKEVARRAKKLAALLWQAQMVLAAVAVAGTGKLAQAKAATAP
jgi:glutamate mutase epsilon subunit